MMSSAPGPQPDRRLLDNAQTLPVYVIAGRQIDDQGSAVAVAELVQRASQVARGGAGHPPFKAQDNSGAGNFFLDMRYQIVPSLPFTARGSTRGRVG